MMQMTGFKLVAVAITLSALAACGSPRPLTPSALTGGADEFSVVTNKSLQSPASLTALPTPTPGGTNITDATPKADAIAALGGRLPGAGVDAGVVSYASRFGVTPNIRAELAASDERFLKRRSRLLTFSVRGSKYERVYKRLALDPWDENERLRALGISVPTVPSSR